MLSAPSRIRQTQWQAGSRPRGTRSLAVDLCLPHVQGAQGISPVAHALHGGRLLLRARGASRMRQHVPLPRIKLSLNIFTVFTEYTVLNIH